MRWRHFILRDLIMRRKTRYHEFLASEEGISTNILAGRLARLEQQGLISKANHPDDCYAFMQAAGLVNDHLIRCFRYSETDRRSRAR